jgi:hypothetical protein
VLPLDQVLGLVIKSKKLFLKWCITMT